MRTRPLSPAARRRLRNGALGWGITLLALWSIITIGVARSYSVDTSLRAQSILWALLLPGILLLALGIRGQVAARRFNRQDSAFADALTGSLERLWRTEAFEAYRTEPQTPEVRDARIVEVERRFDQQTVGHLAGRLNHQLSLFGGTLTRSYGQFGVGALAGAVAGVSAVQLDIQQTTRDNLMGDALFAVLEFAGPAGARDTCRVVSVSGPAAAGWLHGLVLAVAGQLEGPATHAGATVLGWSGNLVAQFAPQDISYTADRLHAQAARAPEQRELLLVRGPAIGRNALLAADLRIGAEQALLLFPVHFPVLLGQAVATAAHEAEAVLGRRAASALASSTG